MTGLLRLPREIRNQIIGHVTQLCAEAPKDYEAFQAEDREALQQHFARAWRQEQKQILLEKSPRHGRDIAALKLTNRQLHGEVQDWLRRRAREPVEWVLDVAYLKDVSLRPTWVSVPLLRPHADRLVARFRMLDVPGEVALSPSAQRFYSLGAGGPPSITHIFSIALRTCLRWGPLGTETIKQEDSDLVCDPNARLIHRDGITVRELVLDFEPTDPTILPLGPDVSRYLRSRRNLENADSSRWLVRLSGIRDFFWDGKGEAKDYFTTFAPEPFDTALYGAPKLIAGKVLGGWIKKWLGRILQLDMDVMEYGSVLYERLNAIEIRVGGQLLERFDIKERFQTLEFPDERNPPVDSWRADTLPRRLAAFEAWREICVRKRREAGLD
ncbi:hypothetical protein TruAng_007269 [Truncatella angustata]|nr:hypothetical protein TruAng_007269 [Truncatella angustata]